MSILKSVVKFVTDPTPVSRLDEVEQGRVALDGVVRVGGAGEIISPVNGRPCVAFYYQAFTIAAVQGGYMPRKLRSAEVYHSFDLEMEGGRVAAVPAKSADFSADDHRALSGEGHENFKATEDLIAPGTKVRIWGKAKRGEEGLTVHYAKLEVLAQPASSDGPKKKRKKKPGKKGKAGK